MRQFYMINLAFFMLLFEYSQVKASDPGLTPGSKIAKERAGRARMKSKFNVDSLTAKSNFPTVPPPGSDTVSVLELSKYPLVTLEQIMKGNISGLYVQEPSAEPGTVQQNMLVRGITRPVFTAKNFKENRPLIVVNGIQIIDETNLIYNIQNEETQPIGAATNIMSLFDLDNIATIEVLKDAGQIAKYGPRAVNGVVYITTKSAQAGDRKISINGYSGFAVPNNVTTVNAEFERNFRQPFYDKYAKAEQISAYPSYLSDSSNVNYYGPSNWVDQYYKLTPLYSINGALMGGTNRSNFRFFANHTQNASGADDTKFNRTYGGFSINMLPTTWFKVSGNIQIGRLARDRNRSLTERYTETKYTPDLSTPLAPNKSLYNVYLQNFDKLTLDNNYNTSVLASLGLDINMMPGLDLSSRIALDYNENRRDVFWPSTLMEGNNYTSNYLGYNERLSFDNNISYRKDLNTGKLLFEAGLQVQADRQKYNYLQAYRGPNDYIKINRVEGDKNKAEYLVSIGFIPYLYGDKTIHHLINTYFRTSYEWNGLELSGLLRRDGSSWQQLSERWYTSYAFNASYDLSDKIGSDKIDFLKLRASYGHLGNLPNSDTEAAGPQYSSALSWDKNTGIMSYSGIGTVSRPYAYGWVGYDVPWSFTDMFNIGFDLSMAKQFGLHVDLYSKTTKNMLLPVPTVAESGYKFEYASGMDVQNSGVDLSLNYTMPRSAGGFSWNSSFNIAYNTNELKKLPNELDAIVVGKNKLEVGKRIDQYWLLQNKGIYQSDVEVPVRTGDNRIMTYNGTDMKGGDPRWVDQDGNFDINNEDRVLMGNIIPKWTGGFTNQFGYKNFDLSFLLYFNLGREIMNQQASKYYDFANVAESKNLYGVREITSWEKNFDDAAYPIYNPWSSVVPYQVEQDLFMENGSFVKLKNLSLGYDLTKVVRAKKLNRLYVYVTGSNLLTITKYSGRDPELVNFYGYDTGAGIRYPKMYTLGVKLDF
ncbi:MAG: SusC/RagA family TonB-linked outer membrane protein [Sphingobacterium sp.]|nr:SusC/RagA family TonB-linked outer membrane protein [Sphingobacterium sp.]